MQTTLRQTEPSPTASEARLRYVTPAEAVASWEQIAERLRRPLRLANGRFDEASILEAVRSRKMQLWLLGDEGEWLGVAVTTINIYPTGLRAFEILMVEGQEMHRWRDVVYQFEDYAREANCSLVEARGRHGWRAKKTKGWKETSVFYEKDLG